MHECCGLEAAGRVCAQALACLMFTSGKVGHQLAPEAVEAARKRAVQLQDAFSPFDVSATLQGFAALEIDAPEVICALMNRVSTTFGGVASPSWDGFYVCTACWKNCQGFLLSLLLAAMCSYIGTGGYFGLMPLSCKFVAVSAAQSCWPFLQVVAAALHHLTVARFGDEGTESPLPADPMWSCCA